MMYGYGVDGAGRWGMLAPIAIVVPAILGSVRLQGTRDGPPWPP